MITDDLRDILVAMEVPAADALQHELSSIDEAFAKMNSEKIETLEFASAESLRAGRAEQRVKELEKQLPAERART